MKKVTKTLLALSMAFIAATALTACDDDDDDAVRGNTFTISNS